ncbi:hypothetical protein L4D77_09565 [Photobacterium frigidiphilum]|uniref:hypothetical protein n=1 Tax=Photobacterium frigidiphilum TaxID=264736 RepID=UPI003D0B5076
MNKLASLIFILSFSLSGCDGSETDYLEPDIINTSVIDFPENTSCQTIENQTSCSTPNNKNFVLLEVNICHIQRIETFNDNGVVTTSNEQYFISQNHGFIKYINSNGEILDN